MSLIVGSSLILLLMVMIVAFNPYTKQPKPVLFFDVDSVTDSVVEDANSSTMIMATNLPYPLHRKIYFDIPFKSDKPAQRVRFISTDTGKVLYDSTKPQTLKSDDKVHWWESIFT